MMNRRRDFMLGTIKLFDITLAITAFFVTTFLLLPRAVTFEEFLGMRVKVSNFIIALFLLCLWHAIFVVCGLYNSRRMSGRVADAWLAFKAATLAVVALGFAALILHLRMLSPTFLVVFWAIVSVSTALNRLVLRSAAQHVRLRGRNLRNLLIVGTGARAVHFANNVKAHPELGYRIIGFVDHEWAGWKDLVKSGYSVVCDFDSLPQFLRSSVVDEVVIALPVRSLHSQAANIAALCEEHGIVIHVLSDIFDFRRRQIPNDPLNDAALLTPAHANDGASRVVKRVLDVVGASLLLFVVSPIMFVAALAIKLTSPGPVLFTQDRVGLHNRQFKMCKFRTMVVDAEQRLKEIEHLNEVSGPVFKIKNDPRITPIGRFLRKTSIDELPQLFNVVKGDMSLVGPRPLPIRDFLGFSQDWQRRRFSVRPGITCLWQVNGRSSIEFDQWMELDLQYIDRWSLWLDFEILVKTIPAVLKGSGAA